MLGHGGSPDPGRLAAEAAEEIGGTQFFEVCMGAFLVDTHLMSRRRSEHSVFAPQAEFANPLESLEHYCRSSLGFQRLAYAQVGSQTDQIASVVKVATVSLQLLLTVLLQRLVAMHRTHSSLCYGLMQGIAAAALTADYQDCVDVLLPLVDHLTHDTEPEIRNAAVQQLCGLGELLCERALLSSASAGLRSIAVVITAGTKLHQKDAERSLRDIETTLSMCAQQCAVDEEDEVRAADNRGEAGMLQLLLITGPCSAELCGWRAVPHEITCHSILAGCFNTIHLIRRSAKQPS